MSKNKPNNPALWSKAKAVAKSKFDVYPSAYANLFASKWYKKHGGTWKKSDTNENYMFDDNFIEEMQVLSGMIAEAKKQEPKKKNEFEEINQLMQSIHSMPVLNEKLRANQIEIGSLLNNEPIKELKKGIGINDRFLFVQELFRGDETMYERSIKTIDGFAIYPEAQFWIQRELKLKIGWNEDSATVKHFDQLVKRRFS